MKYYDNLPAKFQHPRDLACRKAEIQARKRERARHDVIMEVPPERVYQAISEAAGGGVETGFRVTLGSNSAIVWNSNSQKWEAATATVTTQVTPINRVARMVRQGQRGNYQRGGSF